RIARSTAAGPAPALAFDYDGEIDGGHLAGQLGHRTRVRGDGWRRTELFDALGRPTYQQVELTGWRSVTSEKTYRADGSVARDAITVTDAGGAVKLTSMRDSMLDGAGRLHAFAIDGAVLYTLSYDDEGRIARADFASGEAIAFDYDAITHRRRGYQLSAPDASGAMHWNYN